MDKKLTKKSPYLCLVRFYFNFKVTYLNPFVKLLELVRPYHKKINMIIIKFVAKFSKILYSTNIQPENFAIKIYINKKTLQSFSVLKLLFKY